MSLPLARSACERQPVFRAFDATTFRDPATLWAALGRPLILNSAFRETMANVQCTMTAEFKALYEIGIDVMRKQLCRGDVLNGDCVVCGIRDNRVAMRIVVYRRQQTLHVCMDWVSSWREMRNGGLAKIWLKQESVLARSS